MTLSVDTPPKPPTSHAKTAGRPRRRALALTGVGLFLPWLVMLGIVLIQKPNEAGIFLCDFARNFFRSGYNYWLAGVLSALPFAALGVLWMLLDPERAPEEKRRSRRFAIAGAIAAVLLVTSAVEGAVWWNVLGPRPDGQSVIALFLLPFYNALALPLGYGAGALAGAQRARRRGHA